MDQLEKHTLTTGRGMTYTYYVSPATSSASSNSPALIFQHGWPDHAEMWFEIVKLLRTQHNIPNTIIVPDMLGYGGTSKPTDPRAYKWDVMTQDIRDILTAQKVTKVVSIGHDWGSSAAQRLYHYHPDIVTGLVMMNVAYLPPDREKRNLDEINAGAIKVFGYPRLAYWNLFAAPDGPTILNNNIGRIFSVMHASGASAMKDLMCTEGVIRDYLTSSDPELPVRPYATAEMRQAFIDRMQRDTFNGAQQWYVAKNDNYQWECDRELPEDRDKVNVPVLYIGCDQDAVCRPEDSIPSKEKGWLPDIEEQMVVAAHWVPYENPAPVAGHIAEWLVRKGFTA